MPQLFLNATAARKDYILDSVIAGADNLVLWRHL
jgi:hypothetical protein